MKTYNIPYGDIKTFLESLSDETLNSLCKEYQIIPIQEYSIVEQLADVLSDQEAIELGYEQKEEEVSEGYDFEYPDADDLAYFLAHCVNEDTLSDLMKQYDCFSVKDLALALTDAEVEALGYSLYSTQPTEYTDDFVELPCHDPLDYTEEFDYLEDIPYDLTYYVVSPEENIYAVDTEEDLYRFYNSIDTTLIDNFKICDDLFDTNKYVFQIEPHKYSVQEDVIINSELNSNIFDSEHKMIPEVKEQILKYVNNFVEYAENKNITLDFSDITLVGSNAGYLYTPESDIDIHMISSNPINVEIAEQLFDIFDMYEAENPLFIGTYKVELGIEDGYDLVMNNKDTRRYSLVDDMWVNNSDELEHFEPGDISEVEGYEDIVKNYEDAINYAVDNDNYNLAVSLKQEIRKNRSDDLANIGSLSMGNVVFKELRNIGAYGKLKEYIASKEIVGDMQE